MRKLIYTLAILLCCFVKISNAQINVSLGVNIGSQPAWGPVGYDRADYYYLPDIGTYYSISTHQYVYYQNNRWIRTVSLPPTYSNYDVYSGYKVVINERDPWLRDNVYRTRYSKYKGKRDQLIIRDSRDEKYRDHWDNGKHKGQYKQQDKAFKQQDKEMKKDYKRQDKEMKRDMKDRKQRDKDKGHDDH
jgi:hypothetical protein